MQQWTYLIIYDLILLFFNYKTDKFSSNLFSPLKTQTKFYIADELKHNTFLSEQSSSCQSTSYNFNCWRNPALELCCTLRAKKINKNFKKENRFVFQMFNSLQFFYAYFERDSLLHLFSFTFSLKNFSWLLVMKNYYMFFFKWQFIKFFVWKIMTRIWINYFAFKRFSKLFLIT